ncbi:MAG TPA: nucleotidyltransferase family protein [Methanobacterium sp.]
MDKQILIKKILDRDKRILKKDFNTEPIYGSVDSDVKIIADFTEYSPLHLGHRYCMHEAKHHVPDGIFVAIVPGPLERSGRGLPYIMTREARAETAVSVGADIVIEGPPMGIMGSGQYSLCLAKTFMALDADYIPRGYRPFPGFDKILSRIDGGTGVSPKPYKIIDMETREVLLNGKLDEDNYVLVSLSKSMKKIGFDFKGKFIFVKRLEGVSGTKIRESIISGDLRKTSNMLPKETIEILEREIYEDRAPLHNLRDIDGIIERVNNSSIQDLKSLVLIDDNTTEDLINNRPFKTILDVEKSIFQGFSRHYKNRVISSLEAGIFKEGVHKYIDRYPSVIRILKYKNKEVLNEFQKRIPHRRLEIWQ